MRKRFLFLIAALLLLSMGSASFAQMTTLWEKCSRLANMPSWFSTGNNERGMAYGLVGANERIYVVSRNAYSRVNILNATDGSDVGRLDTTGVNLTSATFKLNDVEVSADGVIFASNMVTSVAAATPFKIFMWTSESASAVTCVTLSGPIAAGMRLGDRLVVTGSVADNSVKIFVPAQNKPNYIYRFSTANQGTTFTVDSIIVSGTSFPATGAIGLSPIGNPVTGFYMKNYGSRLFKLNANGVVLDSISTTSVPGSGSNIKYYATIGNDDYIAMYTGGASTGAPGFEMLKLFKIKGGVARDSNCALIANAPDQLGTNANGNSTGDLGFKNNNNGTFTFFLLGTNNGLGCYRYGNTVPVELNSFSANAVASGVQLVWSTSMEKNSGRFDIERKTGSGQFVNIKSIPAAGSSNGTRFYSFTDKNLFAGEYCYRLKMIDADGTFKYSNSVSALIAAPAEFNVNAYPNPFNPSTKISFQLPMESIVKITVYNMLGAEVRVLLNESRPAGNNQINFDGSKLTSGLYFISVEAGSNRGTLSITKKLMLLK